MKMMRPGLFLTAILVSGVAGCAHHARGPVVARPIVSGFAPCDCGPTSGLPRRLSPAPPPGFPGPAPDGRLPPLDNGHPPPDNGRLPPLDNGQPPPDNGRLPPLDNGRPPPDNGRLPPLDNRPPADDLRGYPPPEDPKWRPSPDSNLRRDNPPPIIGDLRDPRATLKAPVIGEQQRPTDPPVDGNALPVDIPQFAFARKQVASGQKPFVDGLDWLRDRGYRTALHVRLPKEDDAAAKRQFTAKGMRYLSLEVSPETLNRDVVEQFNRIVTEAGNLPLFVYDRDSSLLGGLWYLHFRLHEGWSHDKAAMKAGELGLNIEADGGAHKEMWLAVQRYLQMDKPTARPQNRTHTAAWTRQR